MTGCGKVRFRDRIAAVLALQRTTAAAHRGKRREARAYRCGLCAAWHLTSQPAKRDKPATGRD